jgi:hypothetical protein
MPLDASPVFHDETLGFDVIEVLVAFLTGFETTYDEVSWSMLKA